MNSKIKGVKWKRKLHATRSAPTNKLGFGFRPKQRTRVNTKLSNVLPNRALSTRWSSAQKWWRSGAQTVQSVPKSKLSLDALKSIKARCAQDAPIELTSHLVWFLRKMSARQTQLTCQNNKPLHTKWIDIRDSVTPDCKTIKLKSGKARNNQKLRTRKFAPLNAIRLRQLALFSQLTLFCSRREGVAVSWIPN